MKRIIITALLAGLLIPLIDADARIVNRSKYRRVKKGIGNCIFSDRPLPYRKEHRYKVKKYFKEPATIYVRCYFANNLGHYASRRFGKIDNSLMGMLPRGAKMGVPQKYYNLRLQFEEPNRYSGGWAPYSYRLKNWDQIRLDIPVVKGVQDIKKVKDVCDFWKTHWKTKETTCINVADEIRDMKKKTSRVCVYIDFDKVDRRVWKRGKGWVKKYQFHRLARGCFRYRVK